MRAVVLAAAITLAPVPCLADGPKTVTTTGFGCLDYEVFQRALMFAKDNDVEAFDKFLREQGSNGNCRMIRAGQSVFVEKVGPDMTDLCVRPKGETECLWSGATLFD